MATIPPKKFTLRAFRIANPNLTESNSGILRLLEQVLTPVSTAAQRRMPLNVDDPDRELLANYIWSANNSFLFGTILRIIPLLIMIILLQHYQEQQILNGCRPT